VFCISKGKGVEKSQEEEKLSIGRETTVHRKKKTDRYPLKNKDRGTERAEA